MTAHEPLTTTLAAWAHRLTFADLHAHVTVVSAAPVLGAALAGLDLHDAPAAAGDHLRAEISVATAPTP